MALHNCGKKLHQQFFSLFDLLMNQILFNGRALHGGEQIA